MFKVSSRPYEKPHKKNKRVTKHNGSGMKSVSISSLPFKRIYLHIDWRRVSSEALVRVVLPVFSECLWKNPILLRQRIIQPAEPGNEANRHEKLVYTTKKPREQLLIAVVTGS